MQREEKYMTVKSNKVKGEPWGSGFRVSCQQWGDVYVSLTNAALWLKMGSFCLKKERKRRKGWWSRGQVQGWGSGPRLCPTAEVVITSQREEWKTWEAGLGRHGGWMFNSYFPSSPEFFSPYFPKKYNDFDLLPWESWRQNFCFDWPREQTNALTLM